MTETGTEDTVVIPTNQLRGRGDTRRLAVIDIETTGLNRDTGLLLEVGIAIIDQTLREVDSRCVLMATPAALEWADYTFRHRGNPDDLDIAQRMHLDNGLVENLLFPRQSWWPDDRAAVEASASCYAIADTRLSTLFHKYGIDSVPMVGSSVRSLDAPFLDKYMPKLFRHFNHRTIDASALLELARFIDPAGYGDIAAAAGRAGHRTIGDCRRSLGTIRDFASRYGIGAISATAKET